MNTSDDRRVYIAAELWEHAVDYDEHSKLELGAMLSHMDNEELIMMYEAMDENADRVVSALINKDRLRINLGYQIIAIVLINPSDTVLENLDLLPALKKLYVPDYSGIDEQLIWNKLPNLERIFWYDPRDTPPRVQG